MQGEYANGTPLKFWYDYLLAVPILAPAAYLTVRAAISMPWSGRVPRAETWFDRAWPESVEGLTESGFSPCPLTLSLSKGPGDHP